MVDLLSNIEINKDKNKITNLTFIDLSKVFDTLSHNILLEKLRLYGVQGTELTWFKNYLQDRTHKTKYKLTISNKLHNKHMSTTRFHTWPTALSELHKRPTSKH